MEKPTAKDYSLGLMERYMMVSGSAASKRATAYGAVKTEIRTSVSGAGARQTDMVCMSGATVTDTKASGGHVYAMEMAPTSFPTTINTLASIAMGTQTASVNTNGQMATPMLVSFSMA